MRGPEIIETWHDAARASMPGDLEIWDAHTHTGQDDPDGFTNTDTELLAALDASDHAGAVVMTSADPEGYAAANRRVLEEAQASDGRLVSLLRVNPNHDDPRVVGRGLAAGHRGVKLHPRSEAFGMDHPVVREACRIAAEHGAPVLVHSGRGIPSLREPVVRLLESIEGLRLVLAHCAISDLAGLAPEVASHPGLFIDTSWWDVTDRLALAAWVPPDRILYASDTPYGHPLMSFVLAARVALVFGYGEAELRAHFGGTLRDLVAWREPGRLDGPAGREADPGEIGVDAGLLRVHASIQTAIGNSLGGGDPAESIALARAGCDVDPSARHADLYRAIAATLDAVDLAERRLSFRLLVVAAAAALTPGVAVPSFD